MAVHLVHLDKNRVTKTNDVGLRPQKRKRDGLGVRHASQGEEGVHLMLANPPWRSLRERAGKMPRPEARLRIGRIFSHSDCAAQFNKAQKRSDRGPLAILVRFLHPGPVCGLSAGIDEDSRCRSRFYRGEWVHSNDQHLLSSSSSLH